MPKACPVCKDSDDAVAARAIDNSLPSACPVCKAAVTVTMLAWTRPSFLDAISEDVCLATPKHLS